MALKDFQNPREKTPSSELTEEDQKVMAFFRRFLNNPAVMSQSPRTPQRDLDEMELMLDSVLVNFRLLVLKQEESDEWEEIKDQVVPSMEGTLSEIKVLINKYSDETD